MKIKTSVTLSNEVLKAIDRLSKRGESRSSTIERLLADSLARRERRALDDRDRAILDRHADALNAEMEEVLDYQADV
jgi:metal-responsive CopG/Arc/MetJ family transcriptional regulator